MQDRKAQVGASQLGPRKIRMVFARSYPECELPSDVTFKRVLDNAGLVERKTRKPSNESGRITNRIEAKSERKATSANPTTTRSSAHEKTELNPSRSLIGHDQFPAWPQIAPAPARDTIAIVRGGIMLRASRRIERTSEKGTVKLPPNGSVGLMINWESVADTTELSPTQRKTCSSSTPIVAVLITKSRMP